MSFLSGLETKAGAPADADALKGKVVALYFFVVGPEGGGLLDGLKLPQLDGLKLPQFPGPADAQGAASEAAVEVDPAAVSALADPNPFSWLSKLETPTPLLL